MRMTVLDEGKHFDRQTHAYAEYRVFSQLAGDGCRSHRDVTVTLTRLDAIGTADRPVMCAIAVTMDAGQVVNVQALEGHPYAAIDRAAGLIANAVHRATSEQLRSAAARTTPTETRESPSRD